VIDQSTNTLYLDVKTKEIVGGNAFFVQRLHAINVTDGTDRAASFLIGTTTNGNTNDTPIYVNGNGDGSVGGVVQFNALREANRPGLSLFNGTARGLGLVRMAVPLAGRVRRTARIWFGIEQP
jgi:hypothetical protein